MHVFRGIRSAAILTAAAQFVTASASAADQASQLDGAQLSALWVVPFAGLLLSIAIMPLAAPRVWHHHYGKIAAGWALAFIVPSVLNVGLSPTLHELFHTIILEYVPFLVLLFALFTVAGGVLIKGNLHGSPSLNTGILGVGTLLASIAGTTGAAMLLIRPIIRANDNRQHNAHVIVFFIFLVANIGGALTPLGDPPLFLGFLKGVSFFWPTFNLLAPMALVVLIVLAVFYVLDWYMFHIDENYPPKPDPTPDSRLRIEGWANVVLLGVILLSVLLSGVWKPGIKVTLNHIDIELQNVVRDILLLLIAWTSWTITKHETRDGNGFSWGPIVEVAKLFAGIFITIIPAIAILKAGVSGALAPVVRLVMDAQGQPVNAMYFWLTGGLSSFLDNAPTYLVFFNIAGGNAEQLMGPLSTTLLAISAGAVFMGANTYIGNAPNFMVKAIAEERGIKMPSFFGYMLWSSAILIPCFLLVTWVFF
ncbi:sodium:proton antiporter [Hyphomicrobium sp.]|uniref:sodium:proton antiporter n=1 Tax=Hyphomicrobium sp. TaxID=82 RepID=UPI0025C01391|nr:sodium:proton antiporter [Hyphomicrobium sp.]MCC7252512.1 sodium:proton antiporter [Hyphomicrobium sp.]